MEHYDLLIIGAGPGGYPAAKYASKHGLKVCVVEKAHIGGICLNWGCIPTKALLKAAENLSHIKDAQKWGIKINDPQVDIQQMIKQSRETVDKLGAGIHYLFKEGKIDYIQAEAELTKVEKDLVTIKCGDTIKTAKHLIIATGGRQREFPGLPFSKRVWNIPTAMTPQELPKNLAIIGAGAIGIEFANFYAMLGVKVSVFESTDRILRGIDLEIANLMQKNLSQQNVTFHLNANIEKIKDDAKQITITFNKKDEAFDAVLIAIGVVPNSEKFAELDKENGYIKTDKEHRVSIKGKAVENVFAIGDCCSPPWLAHKATHEGLRSVKKILKENVRAFPDIPLCIYTNSQVASIGKMQEECEPSKIIVGKAQFFANGKAMAIRDTQGFVKLIFDKETTALIGAHMIGPDVTELIHSMALAMKVEALMEDIAEVVFPHPTLSETIFDAVLDAMK